MILALTEPEMMYWFNKKKKNKKNHQFLLGTEECVALQGLVSLVLSDVGKHFVMRFVGCAIRYSGRNKVIKRSRLSLSSVRSTLKSCILQRKCRLYSIRAITIPTISLYITHVSRNSSCETAVSPIKIGRFDSKGYVIYVV